jgi:voltage-gated potassium channel
MTFVEEDAMSKAEFKPVHHSNSYNIFMLVLTVFSLVVMVWMILPWISEETARTLLFYNNITCVIFLIDFAISWRAADKKMDFFLHGRGWLDLISSIPSFGFSKYTALLRLFRLSRLGRLARLLSGKNRQELIDDILTNRSQYTGFLTILLTIMVLTVGSVLVLGFETREPGSNINTGWNAFWYAIVTITTVGYGDFYPVSAGGRITAMFIMFMGVGIIGVLASILSSILVGAPPPEAEEEPPSPPTAVSPAEVATTPGIEDELAAIRSELASLRGLMENMGGKELPKS